MGSLNSQQRWHSVQFSRSVVSDSWQPHESQHARPPCPSPYPGVHSNSCPLSWWCHPAISSSVVPFSSCASESFSMSQLFAWGGQSTGASALASFPPKNTQGWSPSELKPGYYICSLGFWDSHQSSLNSCHKFVVFCLFWSCPLSVFSVVADIKPSLQLQQI